MTENGTNDKLKPPDKAESLGKPLLIYYDCEAANGNLFQGDIIEIAARCDPAIAEVRFESLVNSTQELGWFAMEKCGITKDDLLDKPLFVDVMLKFFKWVKRTIKKVEKRMDSKYFPVLCAHGGFSFDFVMLLGNMKRHKLKEWVFKKAHLHFADTFDYCKELQAYNCKEIEGIRLSMDSLFAKFCPGKEYLNRHRAMGDVNAMIDIFCQEPLKTFMNQMVYINAETLCANFHKQYSLKEQRFILEEKMSKLDAYSKCVNLKKLLKIPLTYEGIQRIFENCCSFMDFYETMKDLGIDRKTSKYFACQFGGLGLRNQGTVPYCGFTKPERSDDESDEDLEPRRNRHVDPALLVAKQDENYQRPPNVHELPPADFTIPESSECWDSEVDVNRSFVITFEKPATPLSITIDDFVSPKSRYSKQRPKQNDGKPYFSDGPRIVKNVSNNSGRKRKPQKYPQNANTVKNCVNVPSPNISRNKLESPCKEVLEPSSDEVSKRVSEASCVKLSMSDLEELEVHAQIQDPKTVVKNVLADGEEQKLICNLTSSGESFSYCNGVVNGSQSQTDEYISHMLTRSGSQGEPEYHFNQCEPKCSPNDSLGSYGQFGSVPSLDKSNCLLVNGPNDELQIATSEPELSLKDSLESYGQFGSVPSHDKSNCLLDNGPNDVPRITAASDCVVFVHTEQDDEGKDWPRLLIWVGDIPIYVPVKPITHETTRRLQTTQCTLVSDIGESHPNIINHSEPVENLDLCKRGTPAHILVKSNANISQAAIYSNCNQCTTPSNNGPKMSSDSRVPRTSPISAEEP